MILQISMLWTIIHTHCLRTCTGIWDQVRELKLHTSLWLTTAMRLWTLCPLRSRTMESKRKFPLWLCRTWLIFVAWRLTQVPGSIHWLLQCEMKKKLTFTFHHTSPLPSYNLYWSFRSQNQLLLLLLISFNGLCWYSKTCIITQTDKEAQWNTSTHLPFWQT
jgi:hypothetical protein